MTHEELLDKLQESYVMNLRIGSDGYYHNAQELKALRAVVELHKPTKDGVCEACNKDERGKCSQWDCRNWDCDPDCDCKCHGSYPCPTIQAIEKELG